MQTLLFGISFQGLGTRPVLLAPLQLTGFVDAAHANDLRNRRSTTGYAFILNHGVVAYRSKTQTVTATSSTEAEFIAAVSAAKATKYLRAILLDLGFSQTLPTPIYIDNASAIQIINVEWC
jgi:ribonuclease HI